MFCPNCRAEYRPGFTCCSDCDVDLVSKLSELDIHAEKNRRDANSEKLKREAGRLLPTITNLYANGRKTLHWWGDYRRQTGGWPWTSIAIHFANWIVVLFGGLFLIWWSVEHHWSRWKFLGAFLLVSLPYTLLEQWAKRIAKLNHLRNGRHLAKQQNPR